MIKLWALSDFTCLKTLEGHTNSVLQVHFLTHGMQLLSRYTNTDYTKVICVPFLVQSLHCSIPLPMGLNCRISRAITLLDVAGNAPTR